MMIVVQDVKAMKGKVLLVLEKSGNGETDKKRFCRGS